MYELLNDIKDVHVMNLPHARNAKWVPRVWREECVALKEELERRYDIEITDEMLEASRDIFPSLRDDTSQPPAPSARKKNAEPLLRTRHSLIANCLNGVICPPKRQDR